MKTSQHYRRIKAGREQVYRALIDPVAIAKWKVPDEMSCEVENGS